MITKKTIILRNRIAIIVFFSFFLCSAGAWAGEFGDFQYEVVDETEVTILGYTGAGGDITIPSEIEGLPDCR